MAVVLAGVFAGLTVVLAGLVVFCSRGRSRLEEDARRGRLGVEHARLHLSVLSRAGDEMAGALETYDEALDRLADVVVPTFADWFAVDLADESGVVHRVVAAERSQLGAAGGPAQGDRAVRLPAEAPYRHPDGAALVRRVLDTGGDEVFSSAPRATHRGALLAPGASAAAGPAPGVESMLVVPVGVRGLTLGVLSFVTGPGRRGYRRSDLDTAHGLAQRVATALERVLLWRESREAERAAVARADQLHRLTQAALAINVSLAEPEIVRVLAEQARGVLSAQRASVCTVPRERHRVRSGPFARREAVAGPAEEGAVIAVVSSPVAAPEELGPHAPAVCRLVLGADRPVRSTPTGVEGLREGSADESLVPRPGESHWMAVPVSGPVMDANRVIVAEGSSSDPFGPEDESALFLLAQIASVALVNAHLYQEVRESERRHSAIVESSPLAIAELAPDGEARWWNRAAEPVFGGSSNGAVRGHLVLDPGSLGTWQELLERNRRGDPSVGVDLKSPGPTGDVLEFSVSSAPLLGPAGEVTGIVVVAEDVTERRYVLEQMQQSERFAAMARLASGMAHDFNNLLTVILGSSDLLASRGDVDDTWYDDVESIRGAGKRAAALTAQLLAIGRVRSRKPGVLDPDATLSSITPMLESALGGAVRLDLDPAPVPVRVVVDQTDFERAVVNLAINARDAMPDGGRFALRTRAVPSLSPPGGAPTGDGHRAPARAAVERPLGAPAAQGALGEQATADGATRGAVAIYVSDTGEGMDEQTAQRCFEPFFSTKEQDKGTGLGLFVVEAIVRQAGGRVTVESARGHGTTITMLFPASADSAGDVSAGDVRAGDLPAAPSDAVGSEAPSGRASSRRTSAGRSPAGRSSAD